MTVLEITASEVHLWAAELDHPQEIVEDLQLDLSHEELERAGRFLSDRHRSRYIVAHGVLRRILSRYTSETPRSLEFCYGSRGKPALATTLSNGALHFNCSHSQELALYVFARGREVGVDVEKIRPESPVERIWERFFSPGESARLRAVPAPLRVNTFFDYWTLKEAYIKARGEGLSLRLDRFEVYFSPGGTSARLRHRTDARESARWALLHVDPAPDFTAAVCVEGRQWQLRHYRWNPAASSKNL